MVETASLISLLQGQLALSFVEMGHHFLFSVAHFRPLISEEDDVEMFKAIAAPKIAEPAYSDVYDG